MLRWSPLGSLTRNPFLVAHMPFHSCTLVIAVQKPLSVK